MAAPIMDDSDLISGPSIQQLANQDIDQLGEIVWDWDLDFCQLERGQIECGLVQAVTPDFNFIRMSMNRVVDQQGGSAPGFHSFVTITDASGWVEWCGQPVCDYSLIYHGPGSNFETLTNQFWCAYITTVNEARLQQVAIKMGYPEILGLLDFSEVIKPADNRRILRLRQLQVRYLSASADTSMNPYILDGFQRSLEQQACEEIVLTIMDGQDERVGSSFRGRGLALKRALGFIRENAQEAISVADVAGESGVSSRTLDRAFKDNIGLSPSQCIKSIRLEGVRKELRGGMPGMSVVDIANDWGFWHMGDFANDFRKTYGELPSITLAKESVL